MAETFEDPSKKRRLEDGTSAFAENTAESRKEKLETWLKPLDNEQLVKLLLDMYVFPHKPCVVADVGPAAGLDQIKFGGIFSVA